MAVVDKDRPVKAIMYYDLIIFERLLLSHCTNAVVKQREVLYHKVRY